MPADSRSARRRAGIYRYKARELQRIAEQELRYEGRRKHLLDLATTYERAADQLAPPPPPPSPSSQIFRDTK
jgi:hypothetical protein